MILARRLALVACAALLAAPASAAAAPHLVGIEDERILLHEPEEAPRVVADWVAAGIDVVRIHARWGDIAPAGRRRPHGFRGALHTEPRYRWRELDRAVGLVHRAGMKIMLTVTGPGPLWTSRVPERRNPRHRPHPEQFGEFARAVAARYAKQIDTYLVYNEPNIPGWLDPQIECRGRRCERVAPHLYRQLLQAAYPAIKEADPGAEVVMGELAPIGRKSRSAALTVIPPLTFLRTMACLDERYRPMPRRRWCARFRPVRADALGHHPHGVDAAPDEPSADRRWAKIADLPRLLAVLDRITDAGRFVAPAGDGRLDVHLTEFGYQTSPPDHAIGITVQEQARFLQQAAYIAWRTPRVRSLVHYQWIDEPVRFRAPGRLAYAGWQSGLHFVNGRPKPAMDSFPSPFVVDGDRFWGQVRPGGAHRVKILQRGVDGQFAPVADAVTDERGFFTQSLPADPLAEYRFTWEPLTGGPAPQPPQRRSSTAVQVAR